MHVFFHLLPQRIYILHWTTVHRSYFSFAVLGVVDIVVSLMLDLVMDRLEDRGTETLMITQREENHHTSPSQEIHSFLSEGSHSPPKTVTKGWEIGGRGVRHTGAYSTNSHPLIVTIGAWESGGRREVIGHPYGTSGGRTGLRRTSWMMRSLMISSEE